MEHQGLLERYFHFDMVRGLPMIRGLPNMPFFTIALTRKGETSPDPARLRELIRADMLRESLRTLHWLSLKLLLPRTWKLLVRQTMAGWGRPEWHSVKRKVQIAKELSQESPH